MEKLKSILKNFPLFTFIAIISLIFIILTFIFSSVWLGLVELAAFILVVVMAIISAKGMKEKKRRMLEHVSTNLNFSDGKESGDFPLPVAVCSLSGEVKWFNDRFNDVIGARSSKLEEISQVFDEIGVDSILNSAISGMPMSFDGLCFDAYSHKAVMNGEEVVTIYFVETTKYRKIVNKFVNTRPVIAIITIDNMNEIQQNFKDSDCSAIYNGIEKQIEVWVSDYACFVSKIGNGKFYIVCDKSSLDDMTERKFDILDTVRNFSYEGKYVGATLAVGVGTGADYAECEKNAKLSVDMAFGRGGDQAVIRTHDGYEFFGGISKSVDNGSKVKSRVIASALSELIQGCEAVYIMGHRFADFDSVGSAIGVACIAKSLGKNAYIVIDKERNMAQALIELAENNGFGELFVTEEKALSKFPKSRKNLLVVVDTHIKNFVESTELLAMSKMTVVVDHHRKAVDYIDNTVIFFHDPSASSTSELVTELIEYTPAVTKTGSFVADALFTGIMLDTKNFIIRANSDTFEAAAFLNEQGADSIRVKKLFSGNFEDYRQKSQIFNSAVQYKNCAIAVADFESENLRLISAQAADELLTVNGVDASFVIFRSGEFVCVSARSYGAINVQIIMEYMNGGGHQTMAAVQVKNATVEQVKEELYRCIDKYNDR